MSQQHPESSPRIPLSKHLHTPLSDDTKEDHNVLHVKLSQVAHLNHSGQNFSQTQSPIYIQDLLNSTSSIDNSSQNQSQRVSSCTNTPLDDVNKEKKSHPKSTQEKKNQPTNKNSLTIDSNPPHTQFHSSSTTNDKSLQPHPIVPSDFNNNSFMSPIRHPPLSLSQKRLLFGQTPLQHDSTLTNSYEQQQFHNNFQQQYQGLKNYSPFQPVLTPQYTSTPFFTNDTSTPQCKSTLNLNTANNSKNNVSHLEHSSISRQKQLHQPSNEKQFAQHDVNNITSNKSKLTKNYKKWYKSKKNPKPNRNSRKVVQIGQASSIAQDCTPRNDILFDIALDLPINSKTKQYIGDTMDVRGSPTPSNDLNDDDDNADGNDHHHTSVNYHDIDMEYENDNDIGNIGEKGDIGDFNGPLEFSPSNESNISHITGTHSEHSGLNIPNNDRNHYFYTNNISSPSSLHSLRALQGLHVLHSPEFIAPRSLSQSQASQDEVSEVDDAHFTHPISPIQDIQGNTPGDNHPSASKTPYQQTSSNKLKEQKLKTVASSSTTTQPCYPTFGREGSSSSTYPTICREGSSEQLKLRMKSSDSSSFSTKPFQTGISQFDTPKGTQGSVHIDKDFVSNDKYAPIHFIPSNGDLSSNDFPPTFSNIASNSTALSSNSPVLSHHLSSASSSSSHSITITASSNSSFSYKKFNDDTDDDRYALLNRDDNTSNNNIFNTAQDQNRFHSNYLQYALATSQSQPFHSFTSKPQSQPEPLYSFNVEQPLVNTKMANKIDSNEAYNPPCNNNVDQIHNLVMKPSQQYHHSTFSIDSDEESDEKSVGDAAFESYNLFEQTLENDDDDDDDNDDFCPEFPEVCDESFDQSAQFNRKMNTNNQSTGQLDKNDTLQNTIDDSTFEAYNNSFLYSDFVSDHFDDELTPLLSTASHSSLSPDISNLSLNGRNDLDGEHFAQKYEDGTHTVFNRNDTNTPLVPNHLKTINSDIKNHSHINKLNLQSSKHTTHPSLSLTAFPLNSDSTPSSSSSSSTDSSTIYASTINSTSYPSTFLSRSASSSSSGSSSSCSLSDSLADNSSSSSSLFYSEAYQNLVDPSHDQHVINIPYPHPQPSLSSQLSTSSSFSALTGPSNSHFTQNNTNLTSALNTTTISPHLRATSPHDNDLLHYIDENHAPNLSNPLSINLGNNDMGSTSILKDEIKLLTKNSIPASVIETSNEQSCSSPTDSTPSLSTPATSKSSSKRGRTIDINRLPSISQLNSRLQSEHDFQDLSSQPVETLRINSANSLDSGKTLPRIDDDIMSTALYEIVMNTTSKDTIAFKRKHNQWNGVTLHSPDETGENRDENDDNDANNDENDSTFAFGSKVVCIPPSMMLRPFQSISLSTNSVQHGTYPPELDEGDDSDDDDSDIVCMNASHSEYADNESANSTQVCTNDIMNNYNLINLKNNENVQKGPIKPTHRSNRRAQKKNTQVHINPLNNNIIDILTDYADTCDSTLGTHNHVIDIDSKNDHLGVNAMNQTNSGGLCYHGLPAVLSDLETVSISSIMSTPLLPIHPYALVQQKQPFYNNTLNSQQKKIQLQLERGHTGDSLTPTAQITEVVPSYIPIGASGWAKESTIAPFNHDWLKSSSSSSASIISPRFVSSISSSCMFGSKYNHNTNSLGSTTDFESDHQFYQYPDQIQPSSSTIIPSTSTSVSLVSPQQVATGHPSSSLQSNMDHNAIISFSPSVSTPIPRPIAPHFGLFTPKSDPKLSDKVEKVENRSLDPHITTIGSSTSISHLDSNISPPPSTPAQSPSNPSHHLQTPLQLPSQPQSSVHSLASFLQTASSSCPSTSTPISCSTNTSPMIKNSRLDNFTSIELVEIPEHIDNPFVSSNPQPPIHPPNNSFFDNTSPLSPLDPFIYNIPPEPRYTHRHLDKNITQGRNFDLATFSQDDEGTTTPHASPTTIKCSNPFIQSSKLSQNSDTIPISSTFNSQIQHLQIIPSSTRSATSISTCAPSNDRNMPVMINQSCDVASRCIQPHKQPETSSKKIENVTSFPLSQQQQQPVTQNDIIGLSTRTFPRSFAPISSYQYPFDERRIENDDKTTTHRDDTCPRCNEDDKSDNFVELVNHCNSSPGQSELDIDQALGNSLSHPLTDQLGDLICHIDTSDDDSNAPTTHNQSTQTDASIKSNQGDNDHTHDPEIVKHHHNDLRFTLSDVNFSYPHHQTQLQSLDDEICAKRKKTTHNTNSADNTDNTDSLQIDLQSINSNMGSRKISHSNINSPLFGVNSSHDNQMNNDDLLFTQSNASQGDFTSLSLNSSRLPHYSQSINAPVNVSYACDNRAQGHHLSRQAPQRDLFEPATSSTTTNTTSPSSNSDDFQINRQYNNDLVLPHFIAQNDLSAHSSTSNSIISVPQLQREHAYTGVLNQKYNDYASDHHKCPRREGYHYQHIDDHQSCNIQPQKNNIQYHDEPIVNLLHVVDHAKLIDDVDEKGDPCQGRKQFAAHNSHIFHRKEDLFADLDLNSSADTKTKLNVSSTELHTNTSSTKNTHNLNQQQPTQQSLLRRVSLGYDDVHQIGLNSEHPSVIMRYSDLLSTNPIHRLPTDLNIISRPPSSALYPINDHDQHHCHQQQTQHQQESTTSSSQLSGQLNQSQNDKPSRSCDLHQQTTDFSSFDNSSDDDTKIEMSEIDPFCPSSPVEDKTKIQNHNIQPLNVHSTHHHHTIKATHDNQKNNKNDTNIHNDNAPPKEPPPSRSSSLKKL